jgi:hypothetical protein
MSYTSLHPADVILSHSFRSPTGIGQLVSLLRLSSQHHQLGPESVMFCSWVRGIELVHVKASRSHDQTSIVRYVLLRVCRTA